MAVTPEQAAAVEASGRHARAQEAAIGWAVRAESEYTEAIRQEDYARDRADSSYLRNSVAEARRLAQVHGVRCTEAMRLAEMWARVASVLVPPPDPLELITSELVSTDD